MVEEDLAFRTFDAASAGLDAVRRRAGGGQADGPGLPGTRNGGRLGLNRRPSGGCRLKFNDQVPRMGSSSQATA